MPGESHRNGQRRALLAVELLESRKLLSSFRAGPFHARAEAAALVRQTQPTRPTADRWSWLANTYWYVPTPNLDAVVYEPSTGAVAMVPDQTVYHISGYRSGYFWGETVTQIGQGSPTSSALVGSVTPQGRLLLTFTSSTGTITGYGVMNRKHGVWTMENQMFTGDSGSQVGHWAYMVPTRPGTSSWRSLPSAGVSVPTFMSYYNAPTPTPVGS
ncbi:hypothetical protein [Paludisphaera rhizosphaerae]|uniref:hypothetical protein n=1 Tax=Paludisphaera rhizosphaerae TaxID=2711216 RepID=UPI0013EB06E8|nr:hypothetical protein [Paludisphaera rhizosphaerae]